VLPIRQGEWDVERTLSLLGGSCYRSRGKESHARVGGTTAIGGTCQGCGRGLDGRQVEVKAALTGNRVFSREDPPEPPSGSSVTVTPTP
jgi:hypothetical protein